MTICFPFLLSTPALWMGTWSLGPLSRGWASERYALRSTTFYPCLALPCPTEMNSCPYTSSFQGWMQRGFVLLSEASSQFAEIYSLYLFKYDYYQTVLSCLEIICSQLVASVLVTWLRGKQTPTAALKE